jgi:hypothetical protein
VPSQLAFGDSNEANPLFKKARFLTNSAVQNQGVSSSLKK